DLGIDSIKRVEILGTLRDAVPTLGESTDSSTLDALSRARTLGAIVDKVVEIGGKLGVEKHNRETSTNGFKLETSPPQSGPVRRMVLEVVPSPLASDRPGLLPGGVVVVTDDGRGVARGVASELEAAGHSVVLAGTDEVDFSSPSSVEGLLDLARSSGDVAGIVHALPLREVPTANLDREAWSNQIGPEVKGLFLLARAAAGDLERASMRGGGELVAATSMGGTFATGSDGLDFFPGHGGVAGLVKTLAREWAGVRARVVDFDPRQSAGAIASRLATEILSDDDWSEVGYSGDRRIRLQGVASPLELGVSSKLELASGEPVIVTGGARGITASIAAELASRWRPT
ncbi:MAG: SDR family oxidoreductase, partial [Thermoplasmata archaeon]|nr:SDR family oxidoreductase [Thermoplasmata archaeon]